MVNELAKILKRNTIVHIVAALRAALNVAVYDEIIERNAAINIKLPPPDAQPINPYSQEELDELLAAKDFSTLQLNLHSRHHWKQTRRNC